MISRPSTEVTWEDAVASDDYVAGVHAAGNPYFDYLFGSAATAREVLRVWSDRATSEVACQRARVAWSNGRIMAGYIVLDAPTLRTCRSADLMALLSNRVVSVKELQQRIRTTRGLFSAPEPTEWYLSKVWVHPDFRGQRLGALALADIEGHAAAGGAGAIRLDVFIDNVPARRLYESRSYATVGTAHSEAGLSYVSMRRTLMGPPTP